MRVQPQTPDGRKNRRLIAVAYGASVLVLGGLTWPVVSIEPALGVDRLWQAALHMAARDGLHFGTDIVFTYGPLGFLASPQMFYTATGALALLFVGVLHMTTLALLLHVGSSLGLRGLGLLNLVLAVVALMFITPERLLVIVALLLSVMVLGPTAERRFVGAFPVIIGITAGLAVLIKFNDGIAIGAIGAIATTGVSFRRQGFGPLGWFAGTALATTAVAWMLLGQPPLNLITFMVSSAEIAMGYSAAMGLEEAGREWEYGAAAIAAGLLAAMALTATKSWDRVGRMATLGVVAVATFMAFKHGFVRHDFHSYGYFAFILVAMAAVRAGPRLSAVSGAVGFMILMSSADAARTGPIDPLQRSSNLVQQATFFISSEVRHAARQELRAQLQDYYRLSREALAAIGDQPVHVHPTETAAVWAYDADLRWEPLPLFQAYTAYTAELDLTNAERLASGSGPQRVLQHLRTLDGRHRVYESPATYLGIACHFREVYADDRWQVLARVEDRCGVPRLLSTQTVSVGANVDVPEAEPDEIVYAEIRGLRDGVFERIRALLYKSEPVFITTSAIPAGQLPPDVAENPMVMSMPASLGHSPPFGLAEPAEWLRITYAPSWRASFDTYSLSFFAIPLDR